MKTNNNNTIIKTHIALLSKMIVFATIIGFFLPACGELPNEEKKISGTVTADTDGKIMFMYSRSQSSHPEYCSFTTNLPSPDDQFILTLIPGESTVKREIEGLTPGQKVSWTATVAGNPHNHGSNHFVHIIND